MFEHINIEDLSDEQVVSIYDNILLDCMELYLLKVPQKFPYKFTSIREAKDLINSTVDDKRKLLNDILNKQNKIMEECNNDKEKYTNISSIDVAKVLRRTLKLVG